MALDLTSGSALEYETILYGNMSPKMAAEYLQQKRINLRSFSQTLREMYPKEDLTDRLITFYQKIRPDKKRSSISKSIRNWLNDHNDPFSREDYFRISFALDLNEGQLNFLLGMCTDYTVQYRNGREAVLAWFLRFGYSYTEALDFLEEFKEDDIQKSEKTDISSLEKTAEASRLTHEIRNEFKIVQTRSELRECYLRNRGFFGKLHLRSYFYFEQYLDLLAHPQPASGHVVSRDDSGIDTEPDYSIETVMDTYLHMKMPYARNRGNYSLIQKLIKNNWPNSTKLKNIRNHVDDVPRKLLLLLYVITENSVAHRDYSEMDEEYVSLEERVEDHWWTLNASPHLLK